MAGARGGQSTRAEGVVVPAVAAGRRGVGLRGLAVVRPHAVSHRYRHLSDGRSSLAGRASAVWRWCVVPHTHRAEPPVHLSSTGGRPVQPIRLVADAGCQRRDHGANPGAADRVDGDRADRPRRMANLPTGTRALGYAGCGWPCSSWLRQRFGWSRSARTSLSVRSMWC